MVPKVTVYIRQENWQTLLELPSGLSEWTNDGLEKRRHEHPLGEAEKRIVELRQHLENLEAEFTMRSEQASEISNELAKVKVALEEALTDSEFSIDTEDFMTKVYEHAEPSCDQGRIFGNVRNNTHYQYGGIDEGKIYITNVKTGRRNFNFGPETIHRAIERLKLGLGKVKLGGGLIRVPMHEEALIALHPDLWVQGEWIAYIPDFEFEDTHAAIIHCKRCGVNDFNKIYGPQHDPNEEPDSIDYCKQCGHLADLALDFPDAGEDYADWAADIAFETHRERERGI